MGLLTSLFGGGKTSSAQTQASDSFGSSVNTANSSSSSGSLSSGTSGGVSSSRDSIFSADMLRQLYGSALGAAGGIDTKAANDRVNQLFTGGLGILDTLGGGGAGEEYLNKRLSGDNGEVLNGQIDALGNDLGRFFTDTLNPAITGSAVAAGQLGGGRQGVAQTGAMDSVLREFSTQAANLRATDITNRDSAALGLLGAQNQRGATQLGALGELGALGSNDATLDPYKDLASIFGGPVVTTDASSSQFSEQQAQEYATSIAEELGISYDEAHALLTATSKGKTTGGIIPGISGLISAGKG